jgi:chaperonin cofactor prefoldin
MELQKEQADLQSKIEKLRQSLQTAVQQAPQQ